jgi:hypothetical protein
MRDPFQHLQSNLGVVFWAGERSLSDLADEDYDVVQGCFDFVCDALSPLTSELETCLRMAVRRRQKRTWGSSYRDTPTNDADDAVRAVLSSFFSEKFSTDLEHQLKDVPDVAWRQTIYPAGCSGVMNALSLNQEPLWKRALGPVMELEMDAGFRRAIVADLLATISSLDDLHHVVATVAETVSPEELSQVYQTICEAVHGMSMPDEEVDEDE